MYVPKHFDWQDRAEIAAMIAAHTFGLLVTHSAAGLEATHLPFLYDDAAAAIREQNNAYLDESIGAYAR